MVGTRGIARLGMSAVGLGLGAAMALSPGVASADPSSDWLSSVDSLLGGGALPAPSSGLDLAISFDGYSLVQDGNAFAYTFPGDYSLAIADGDGSVANGGGTLASAFADGANAAAYATGGTGDYALADGTNALAQAGGLLTDTGANFDTAIDIGNNDFPLEGIDDGAYAGNSDLAGVTDGGTGSYDTAIDIGNNTSDGSNGGYDGSFAGAGGLISESGNGNNDTAIDVGNNSGFNDGSRAVEGNGNYVSESGSTTGVAEGANAVNGNDNTAVTDTNYTVGGDDVYAGNGNDNYAADFGPENSNPIAAGGDSNIAYIFDPFGSTASEAYSGFGNSSDLAAVVLTDGNAFATTGSNLYDILTAFGLESGTF